MTETPKPGKPEARPEPPRQRPDLRKKALPLFGVALGMLGMAYAAVPLYDLFCRVTGFGGRPMERTEAAAEVLDRTITVRFDASTASDMPWEFRPVQTTTEIRIGETGLAFYEAYNPTDRQITGTASFNVAPFSMGGYFVKIDCFCFTEQTLAPGERVSMPVTYYVDPEMLDDSETEGVSTVTLSYTFYETEPAEDDDGRRAALD
ncbi:cytochrome c oxidase assembly protein [Paralimibaculum aggregatum]|uniref:Cytochrome c oxidase assembly protein CtaG n=1 Tax=Paralimibaculum aggregatum TaxID=3036245 RepID=A0ABQ6LER6_9RHOB|nr:cytochrome c oxidase assembly protein [Limibaculum sp. NKW23]GMG81826.1 cytochrome c oxidase assembly protein [Limibaculum sp. NKW23]